MIRVCPIGKLGNLSPRLRTQATILSALWPLSQSGCDVLASIVPTYFSLTTCHRRRLSGLDSSDAAWRSRVYRDKTDFCRHHMAANRRKRAKELTAQQFGRKPQNGY